MEVGRLGSAHRSQRQPGHGGCHDQVLPQGSDRSDRVGRPVARGNRAPDLGRISLDGVLRSELQPHLSREIGRFIQDPQISTQALVRLSVQGAVARPGFFVAPSTALLGDVIMLAGGPAQNADVTALRIERSGIPLIEGAEMQEALTAGRSLDQLNLLAGDELTVPTRNTTGGIWRTIGRYALIIASTMILGIRIL